MSDLNTGCTWSDERHKVRLGLRTAIGQIAATTPSNVLTSEDNMQVLLEVAVAHFAWGDEPEETARQIGRLAYRVRTGDKLEL